MVKNHPEPAAQNRQAGPAPKPNTGGEGISEPELKQAEHTLKPKTGRDEIENNTKMDRDEDMQLAKIEIVDLKTCIQNKEEQIKKLKEGHVLEIKEVVLKHDRLNEEYQKALTEIAKLEREKGLMKARADVLLSFDELALTEEGETVEVEECIQDEKCKGNCSHIIEEDLRNLRNFRKMKLQGGIRSTPTENPLNQVVHRCPQCDYITQDKTTLEKHVKEVHSNQPTCPFCSVGFTNHLVLRKHIDQIHKEKTLQIFRSGEQDNNSAVQSSSSQVQISGTIKRKRGICAFFLQPRGCKKGSDCDFSHEQTKIFKVRKLCRNGQGCSWKPGCKYIHLEDGEVMPPREQKVQGFVMPDLSQPPPAFNLASSTDFPNMRKESVLRINPQFQRKQGPLNNTL